MVETPLYPSMDMQARLMKEHVEYIFERIGDTVKDLSKDELSWTPCRDSNTVKWILTHMVMIGYILIPQVIQGTVKPRGWDDDYEEQPHSLDELLSDLERAHMIISEGLSETCDEELAAPLTIWSRETDRKSLLFHLLAELIHHNGQIAMLRGSTVDQGEATSRRKASELVSSSSSSSRMTRSG